MNSKIALGTAQFGLNYGINNKTGKVSDVEVKNILILASKNKINIIDTAYLYGDSEVRLGDYLYSYNDSFNIITKLPHCNKIEVQNYFNKSLNNLKVKNLYGYLYHSFKTFLEDESTFNDLLFLQKESKISKIGFSLYYPSELELLFAKNLEFQIVQIPYNLLDKRFEIYFDELKNKNIEIHVRSVFFQGLFFKNICELNRKFKVFQNILIELNRLTEKYNSKIDEIALGFALRNKKIDKIVCGIDNSNHLQRLLQIEKMIPNDKIYFELDEIISKDKIKEEFLLPYNWN